MQVQVSATSVRVDILAIDDTKEAEVDDVLRWSVSTHDLAIAHPGIPTHVVGAAGGLSSSQNT